MNLEERWGIGCEGGGTDIAEGKIGTELTRSEMSYFRRYSTSQMN
jgi:hypothetical protein